jgi:hypothetical protein
LPAIANDRLPEVALEYRDAMLGALLLEWLPAVTAFRVEGVLRLVLAN